METRPLDKMRRQEWNDFCHNSDSAWLRHTTHFQDFILHCRADNGGKNLSFGVYDHDELIAVVPLIAQAVYEKPEVAEFAFADSNTPSPAFRSGETPGGRADILKRIFAEIDTVAAQHAVSYARFFVDPLSEYLLRSRQRINPLTKFGYNETSLSTTIIDLSKPEQELFGDIRKGHKADIKAAEKSGYVVEFFNAETVTQETFGFYKELHLLDAGRKTRPDASWDDMHSFIKSGNGALALLRDRNRYATGAVVMAYKKNAYYSSGATHPEFAGARGVGHLLQWETIRYLKRSGFARYEIGWNYHPGISQKVVSEKDVNISRFKAGFGGDEYPLFRGEKFYTKDYFLKESAERIEKFSQGFER